MIACLLGCTKSAGADKFLRQHKLFRESADKGAFSRGGQKQKRLNKLNNTGTTKTPHDESGGGETSAATFGGGGGEMPPTSNEAFTTGFCWVEDWGLTGTSNRALVRLFWIYCTPSIRGLNVLLSFFLFSSFFFLSSLSRNPRKMRRAKGAME